MRAGLGAIGDELTEAQVGKETLLRLRRDRRRLPRRGQVRLLGAFDTYLLGYRDRGFAVTPEHVKAVKEGGGGWIRPVIVRDGLVVGGWRVARREGRLEVSLPENLTAEPRGAIEAEVADLGRFEGLEVAVV